MLWMRGAGMNDVAAGFITALAVVVIVCSLWLLADTIAAGNRRAREKRDLLARENRQRELDLRELQKHNAHVRLTNTYLGNGILSLREARDFISYDRGWDGSYSPSPSYSLSPSPSSSPAWGEEDDDYARHLRGLYQAKQKKSAPDKDNPDRTCRYCGTTQPKAPSCCKCGAPLP